MVETEATTVARAIIKRLEAAWNAAGGAAFHNTLVAPPR
jgi:hypothetical protein